MMINIRKLESDLWESADLLRVGSKLTSNQYCMPVLGLLFLRYAYSRFKLVEKEVLANRPVRNGRVLPVDANDFKSQSALFLPEAAQYPYLVNLPANIAEAGLSDINGMPIIIRDSLFVSLPQSYDDQSINRYTDLIYEHVYNRYPAIAG